MGLAVHGEAAELDKKLTFYANKSVDGLQLGEYLADFGKWGTILIVTSCLTLSMPYFTSGGHFSDLLRCSKVRQLKGAIVTLRSDQQGDTVRIYAICIYAIRINTDCIVIDQSTTIACDRTKG